MTRLEANRKIIEALSNLVEKNPDQRFFQLLVNANILEPQFGEDFTITGYHNYYGVESKDTLDSILNSIIHNNSKN